MLTSFFLMAMGYYAGDLIVKNESKAVQSPQSGSVVPGLTQSIQGVSQTLQKAVAKLPSEIIGTAKVDITQAEKVIPKLPSEIVHYAQQGITQAEKVIPKLPSEIVQGAENIGSKISNFFGGFHL